MKRVAGLLVTLALVGGCASPGDVGMGGQPGGGLAGGPSGGCMACNAPQAPPLKNAVGPWGEQVRTVPPVGPHAPGALGGVGPEMAMAMGGMPPMMPGMPGGMPPMPPGMVPPPGVMQAGGFPPPGGVVPAVGNGVVQAAAPGVGNGFPCARSQVRFVGPAGAKIGWYVAAAVSPDSKPILRPHQLDLPGRYNFLQASIYRLKLSDIPGRPGLELYPSLEVVPGNAKTEAFLAHNYIPVEFTEEDFDQVTAGNYITKVIYLPDAQYQTPVDGGVDTLVSTRLEPGQDPCTEAQKRGHILLVVRLGGIDLESANSPALDSPGPFGSPRPGVGAAPALPPSGPSAGPLGPPPMLPGVANPNPPGAPSAPPTLTAPPAPKFDVPTTAPAGPMVPAQPGTLPPMPVPGGATGKATTGGSNVQPVAYQLNSDGTRSPAAMPAAQRDARYPLTSIPPGKAKYPIADEEHKSRRGVLDGFWGN